VPTSVADKDVNEEIDDSYESAATTATSLDVEQDKARVESFEYEGLGEKDASKDRRIADIDANEDITLDKGKSKMIKEPVKLKKKDQIQLDEEVALKLHIELQAEFYKEQRIAKERAQQEVEANIALIES
nr:hypothetical protein [Tanacetum cinerariifolium]